MAKTLDQVSKKPQQIFRTKEETQPAFRPRYDPVKDNVRDATKDVSSLLASSISLNRQEHEVSVGIARTMASDHIMAIDEEIKFINSQMKPGESRDTAIAKLQGSIATTSGVAAGLSGDAAQAYDEMYIPSARKLATGAMTAWKAEQMGIDYANLQQSFDNFLDVADGLDPQVSKGMLNLWGQRLGTYTKGGDSKVYEKAAVHIVKGINAEVSANPAASNQDMAKMLMNRNFMGLVKTDASGNITFNTDNKNVNSLLSQAITGVIKPAYEDFDRTLKSKVNSSYTSESSRLGKLDTMGRTLLKSADPREQAKGAYMIKQSTEGQAKLDKQYKSYTAANGDSYSGTTNPILGKRGGSRSWRNNNPGNISGKTLFRGAIGFHTQSGAKASGDRSILVFPSMQAGWDAMEGMLDKNYSSGPIEKTFGKYQEASMSGKIRDVRKAGIDTKRSWGSLNKNEKLTLMKIWSEHEGYKEGTSFDSGVDSEGLMNVAAAEIGQHKTTKGDYDQFVAEFRKQETFMLKEAERTNDYSKVEALLDDAATMHTKYGVRNAKIFSSEKANYKNKKYDVEQKEAKRLYDNTTKENKALFDSGTVDVAAAKQGILEGLKKVAKVEGVTADNIRSDIAATKTASLVAQDPNMPNNLMDQNNPQAVHTLNKMKEGLTGEMKAKVDEYYATGYPSTVKYDEDIAIGKDLVTDADYAALDARSETSAKRVAEGRAVKLLQTFNSSLRGNKWARATFENKMRPGNVNHRELTAFVKYGTNGLVTNGVNGYIQRENSSAAMMSVPKLEAEFIQNLSSEKLSDYLFYKQIAKGSNGKPMDSLLAAELDSIKIGTLTSNQTKIIAGSKEYQAAEEQIQTIDQLPVFMRRGMQMMAQKLAISGQGAAIPIAIEQAMGMFQPVNSSGDGTYVQMTAKIESLFTRGGGAKKEIVMEKVASYAVEKHLIGLDKFDNIEANLELIENGNYTVYEKGGQHFVQVFTAGTSYFNLTVPFDPDELSLGYTQRTYTNRSGQEFELTKNYGVIVKD